MIIFSNRGSRAHSRLRRRRLTGMSRALGFALADGVRRAGTARRLAERETGETVGKLSIVCHVLHPLETIALPECAGRRCRRTAKPRHATGLSYSGHKYITGEMRERFCANPADTGRRQAKRRLTLGDGGLSVRNPTLGDGGLPVRNPTFGDGGPSFRERSMNHPLKCRTPPRRSRLARPIGLQRACTTRAFDPTPLRLPGLCNAIPAERP